MASIATIKYYKVLSECQVVSGSDRSVFFWKSMVSPCHSFAVDDFLVQFLFCESGNQYIVGVLVMSLQQILHKN